MVHFWNRRTRNWARRVVSALHQIVRNEPLARIQVYDNYRAIYVRWASDIGAEQTTRLLSTINFLTNPIYFRGYAPFTVVVEETPTNMRVYIHHSIVYSAVPEALPKDMSLQPDENFTVIGIP